MIKDRGDCIIKCSLASFGSKIAITLNWNDKCKIVWLDCQMKDDKKLEKVILTKLKPIKTSFELTWQE